VCSFDVIPEHLIGTVVGIHRHYTWLTDLICEDWLVYVQVAKVYYCVICVSRNSCMLYGCM